MMRWRLLSTAALLAGCGHRAPLHPSAAHYEIGKPYQLAGLWYYPREAFDDDETGLAERLPDRTGATADGEAFDGRALAAAHRTLQLPAIARVTNLENGRHIEVRLTDRGPATPGRLLGLTPRAADLLGIGADPMPIRLQVESDR